MKNEGFFPSHIDFPMIIELNFSKILDAFYQYIEKAPDFMSGVASQFVEIQELELMKQGFLTPAAVKEHREVIDTMLEMIFPYPLRNNEIKAAIIPFVNHTVYASSRFRKILSDAGEDFDLKMRNMDEDRVFFFGCSMILNWVYGYKLDFRRPLFFDIPDSNGKIRNYRVTINADFMDIIPTEKAKKITHDDYVELINNADDIDLWKEKFPPNSYIFRGFTICNMFDATMDETISKIKTNFIESRPEDFPITEQLIRELFGNESITVGITRYERDDKKFYSVPHPLIPSLLLEDKIDAHQENIFCHHLIGEVLNKKEAVAISNVEFYGNVSNHNQFYHHLKKQGFNSYMCAPLIDGDTVIGILELGCKDVEFLNTLNLTKLRDIVPIMSIVMKRRNEERLNLLEVIIQEECTSIHPSVSWRFVEEAEKFMRDRQYDNDPTFRDIVFPEVYPLYGQSDIRGSSTARNVAIQKDLFTQLDAAQRIIEMANKKHPLPIYNELIYRLDRSRESLQGGLGAGADQQILSFLQAEVYPVFSHLRTEDSALDELIQQYVDMLNPELKTVYKARRAYDESVNMINKHLAAILDARASEAQKMFPHFFERYKTDGIEYNIYIGQSLVKDRTFNPIYLQNLKLWQLTTMCEIEREHAKLKPQLAAPLDIATLILAYSTPLSIRFRVDEKQFDVDGAYNARYEIVKKRIDKAHIKGSSERLTQPGKIAIVYSNQDERIEYDKYAAYLRALNLIKGEVEYHTLEDLQGITGLRAMRYTVNYDLPQEATSNGTLSKHETVAI